MTDNDTFTSEFDDIDVADETLGKDLMSSPEELEIEVDEEENEENEEKVEIEEDEKPEEKEKEKLPFRRNKRKKRVEEKIGTLTRLYRKTQDELRERDALLDRLLKERAEETKSQQEARAKSLDDQIVMVRTQLANAIEGGDTESQIELQDKLVELRTQKVMGNKASPAEATNYQPQQPAISETERDWMERNDFNNWPVNEKEVAAHIYRSMQRDGGDPGDPSFYEEFEEKLSKSELLKTRSELIRLAKSNSDEFAFEEEDEKEKVDTKEKSGKLNSGDKQGPTTTARSGFIAGSESSGGKRRLTLTREQAQTMIEFGLDPKKPDDVKNFFKYKDGK